MSTTPAPPTAEEVTSVSTRRMLWALIISLIVALLAFGYILFLALRPIGAPARSGDGDGLVWVRSIYGWGESAEELLMQPTDVAVGPDGTMWTTDPTRARVVGFTPSGALAGIIQSSEPSSAAGQIGRPEGVGVDAQGNVYVADIGNNKILQFDERAEFVREWEVPSPLDVATRDGEIVVSTIFGIAYFDESGAFVRRTGMRGHAEDEFDVAHGVALAADGTLYVADTQNARVKALTDEGDTLWINGAPNAESIEPTDTGDETETVAQFQIPSGVAIDGAGRPVVIDAFAFALVVLDPSDGSIVGTYGEDGSTDGRFLYPTGIAYDPARDYFVVADTTNDRLQIVTIPGSGGGAVEATRRTLAGPTWLFAVPPILLGIAIWLVRRRRRRVVTTALEVAEEAASGGSS